MKKYLITLFLVAALAGHAGADSREWTGADSNDWFTNANWNPDGSPASNDNLTVNSGSPAATSAVYTSDGGSITFNNSGTSGLFLDYFYIGYPGIGTLNIKNDADVTATWSGYVGLSSGSTGTATVDGSGSTLNTNYGLHVGVWGTGTLNIKNDADVTNGYGYIGTYAGSNGTATVDGYGSTWNTNYDLYVGLAGTGTLNIKNDADVTSSYGSIGYDTGSEGTATVDGYDSTWNTSFLWVGNNGTGTLNIKNGADVTSSYSSIGTYAGSEGTVTVDSYNSTWNTGNVLYIGSCGTGTLNITNDADVTSSGGCIGTYAGSEGTANVDGYGSTWNTNYDLYVGLAGTGTLNIKNGADVTSSTGYIGDDVGSKGTVTVDGHGSTWNTNYDLHVGFYGTGTLNVSNDAQVITTGTLQIGAKGTVNLAGGKLSAANLFGAADTLNFTGGELEITTGNVDISAISPLGSYLSMTSGQVLDVQNGTTTVTSGSALSVNNGKVYSYELQNDGDLSIGSGGQVYTYDGLTNSSSMNMSGGTISEGKVTNDFGAHFNAGGTVNAALDNYGSIELNGILTVGGAMDNYGSVNISTSETLRQNVGLDNYGTINLTGGSITGSGVIVNYGIIRGGSAIGSQITNDGGLIHANGSSTLLIKNMSGNINGGEMRVDNGAGINVLSPLYNTGTIALNGSNATFSGGTISNTGTILGQGRVSNQVNNDGTIRASAGTLTLAGSSLTNSGTGRIEVLNNSTVFITQGLTENWGSIALQGGSFDNANHSITNNGSITGYGTFRSGGLTNEGHIGVGYGDLEVIGTVQHNGTCDIQGGSTAVFFNDVSGSGSFGGTGTAMFLGNLSPGSSPGIMSFQTNVILGSGSKLIMELGGLVAGNEYDVLDVAGRLILDGILDIRLINPFIPKAGNIFDILDFNPANLFGTFDTIKLPTLPAGLVWNTSSLYTVGEIGVVPEPATICLLGLGALNLIRRKK
jgi:T5SS/PEP-CTERM-associated repeat protein